MNPQEQRQRHTVVQTLENDTKKALASIINQTNEAFNAVSFRNDQMEIRSQRADEELKAILRQDILDEHTALMSCLHSTQDEMRAQGRVMDIFIEFHRQGLWGRLKWLVRGAGHE